MEKEKTDIQPKNEEIPVIVTTDLPQKIGRPSKYTPYIAERWLECRKNGASIAQSMLLCDIRSWATYKQWQLDYPEFKEAVEFGEIISQAGWEKIGEQGIKGEIEKFNAATFIFMMCNRYPQHFRQQNNGGVNVQVNNVTSENLSKLSSDELNEKAKVLAQKLLDKPVDKKDD
jgi:hypothetical protein